MTDDVYLLHVVALLAARLIAGIGTLYIDWKTAQEESQSWWYATETHRCRELAQAAAYQRYWTQDFATPR